MNFRGGCSNFSDFIGGSEFFKTLKGGCEIFNNISIAFFRTQAILLNRG